MSDHYEDEEDIILSELPTDELVEQMQDDLYDGLEYSRVIDDFMIQSDGAAVAMSWTTRLSSVSR